MALLKLPSDEEPYLSQYDHFEAVEFGVTTVLNRLKPMEPWPQLAPRWVANDEDGDAQAVSQAAMPCWVEVGSLEASTRVFKAAGTAETLTIPMNFCRLVLALGGLTTASEKATVCSRSHPGVELRSL